MILEEIFKAVNYKVKQTKNKHMKSSNISFMSVSKSLKPMELQFKGYGKAVTGGNIGISLWKTACLISSQDMHIKVTRSYNQSAKIIKSDNIKSWQVKGLGWGILTKLFIKQL